MEKKTMLGLKGDPRQKFIFSSISRFLDLKHSDTLQVLLDTFLEKNPGLKEEIESMYLEEKKRDEILKKIRQNQGR